MLKLEPDVEDLLRNTLGIEELSQLNLYDREKLQTPEAINQAKQGDSQNEILDAFKVRNLGLGLCDEWRAR